jgi:hypothetical protein
MACVLTVALIKDGQATIGHVGDTRLYKIRKDRIEKITRDHSPVGEREDCGELSESEAMRHPRRNEVYRDVGSEPHQPGDPEFVDLETIRFEDDAALVLCSDGLSDLVRASSIAQIVARHAGNPDKVVRALIDAANAAGGKDNVTAVYVEGERFASTLETPYPDFADHVPAAGAVPKAATGGAGQSVRIAIVILVLLLIGAALARPEILQWLRAAPSNAGTVRTGAQVVQPGESIGAAIGRADRGATVVVEPGEYREQVFLRDNVRLVSRVPRGATIRLPVDASEADTAVIAEQSSSAEIAGFRIIGDAATPLGTGLRAGAAVSIVDLEITGATRAAIEFSGEGGTLIGSEVHDNPGAAMILQIGSSPRISHNTFARNGMSQRADASFALAPGARPLFEWNVFSGISPEAFLTLDRDAHLALSQRNWFLGVHASRAPAASARGARPSQGR